MLDLALRALGQQDWPLYGRLVETTVTLAAAAGIKQMYPWVGTEDLTAGYTEMALLLPLEDDPATVPDAVAGSSVHPDPVTQPGRG
jgi:hypothetical protein